MPSPQFELIKSIREKFPLDGVPENNEDPVRSIAQFGIKLFVNETFQSPTHFVTELIQNADDAEYGQNVVPFLKIIVESNSIVFVYNEIGFNDDQVRGLCRLGESTKKGGNQSDNSIGEKGVGFKSVFQVSNRPEVHSNGFHFCFDKSKHGNFGVVVPEWIADASEEGGTRIVLPLNEKYVLPPEFKEIFQPEFFLFLQKIKRFEFRDQSCSIELVRSDDGSIVEFKRTQIENERKDKPDTKLYRFRMCRQRVEMRDIIEENRKDKAATEVAIALELDEDGKVVYDSPRDLFAFLPVKHSQFKFLAHADFLLANSREGVIEGREWNVRLRDKLGECLANSIIACQSTGPLGATALQVITDPKSEQDKFLGVILTRSIECLTKQKCVPTIDGGWVCPANSLISDSGNLWKLVPNTDLFKILQKHYVNPETNLTTPLRLLGVNTFSLDSLLTCINTDSWRATLTQKWFGDLYSSLGLYHLNAGQIETLKKSKILLLEKNKVVTASRDPVFRSLGTETKYGFEHELTLIDPGVLSSIPNKDLKEAATNFLELIGVTDTTPTNVIEKYILETHREDKWKKCTDELLIGHAHYIRDYLKNYIEEKPREIQGAAKKEIAANLTVLTTAIGDERHAILKNLYLGAAFKDPYDIETMLGNSRARVSPTYLKRSHSNGPEVALKSWSDLFQSLGAMILPSIINPDDNPEWAPEVSQLINSTDVDKKGILLLLIDQHWSTRFSQFQHRKQTAANKQPENSRMMTDLQKLKVATKNNGEVALMDTYIDSPENRSVFGDSVSYLAIPLKSELFAKALGVTWSPDVQSAIHRLENIKRSSMAPSHIHDSVATLYRFLELRIKQSHLEIKNAFKTKELILVNKSEGGIHWETSLKCCWKFSKEIQQFSSVAGLSELWRQYEDFFCTSLGVAINPSPDTLIEALSTLSKSKIPDEKNTKIVRQIYRLLSQEVMEFKKSSTNPPQWLRRFQSEKLIWTKSHLWLINSIQEGRLVVFAADDSSLESLFVQVMGIDFIDLEREDLTNHSELLNALNIPKLSEIIRVEVPENLNGSPWPDFNERLNERLRTIARYLHHKHPRLLEQAIKSNKFNLLSKLNAQKCTPLKLKVSLNDYRKLHQFDLRLIENNSQYYLYIQESENPSYDSIGIEFGRQLGLSDTDSLPIGTLLDKSSLTEAKNYLDKVMRIPELPTDIANTLFPETDAEPLGETTESFISDVRTTIDDISSSIDNSPLDTSANGHLEPAQKVPSEINADVFGGSSLEGALEISNNTKTNDKNVGDTPTNMPSADKEYIDSDDDQSASWGNTREGPPTQPRTGGSSTTKPWNNPEPERMRSYVSGAQNSDDDDSSGATDTDRKEIGDSAIRHVLAWEQKHNRIPIDMNIENPSNVGWDITSKSSNGEDERYIEVKGVSGKWGQRGVHVTPHQFKFATTNELKAWLYVVENALSETPQIHRIQNYAARVWRFGFDNGWAVIAEGNSEPELLDPKDGMSVELISGLRGIVSRVYGHGENKGVDIKLADGTMVRTTWKPEQVKPYLSEELP